MAPLTCDLVILQHLNIRSSVAPKLQLIFHTSQLAISQSSSCVVSFFLKTAIVPTEHYYYYYYFLLCSLRLFRFRIRSSNKLVTLLRNGTDHNEIIPLIKVRHFWSPTEQT